MQEFTGTMTGEYRTACARGAGWPLRGRLALEPSPPPQVPPQQERSWIRVNGEIGLRRVLARLAHNLAGGGYDSFQVSHETLGNHEHPPAQVMYQHCLKICDTPLHLRI